MLHPFYTMRKAVKFVVILFNLCSKICEISYFLDMLSSNLCKYCKSKEKPHFKGAVYLLVGVYLH